MWLFHVFKRFILLYLYVRKCKILICLAQTHILLTNVVLKTDSADTRVAAYLKLFLYGLHLVASFADSLKMTPIDRTLTTSLDGNYICSGPLLSRIFESLLWNDPHA